MISIAIVEDEPPQLEQLCEYVRKFQCVSGNDFSIHTYTDGDELVDNFKPGKFHIVLLDIQMRRIDGLTAARKIRDRDENVIVMFITNIVQYAVKGYSVQALDFVVKPIDYETLAQKLEAAIDQVHKQKETRVGIKLLSGYSVFRLDEIVCIEIISRRLLIHTLEKTYPCNETLQGIEEKLNDERFYRCHSAFLVNLQHVRKIDSSTLLVATKQVPVSRHRHKGLMDALTKYLGRQN